MASTANILNQLNAALAVGSSDCSDEEEIGEKLSKAGVKTYGWEPVGTETQVFKEDFAKAIRALGLQDAPVEVEGNPLEGFGAEIAYINGGDAIGARLEFVLPKSISIGGAFYGWMCRNVTGRQKESEKPCGELVLKEAEAKGKMKYVPSTAGRNGEEGIEFSLERLVKELLGM